MNGNRSLIFTAGIAVAGLIVPGSSRPSGTQETDLAHENCFQLFKDSGFRGTSDAGTIRPVTSQEERRPIQVPQGYNDNVSCLKWNLPPGIIVVFYKDEGGKSRQYVVFGKGEDAELKDNDIADAITSWSWYRVGD